MKERFLLIIIMVSLLSNLIFAFDNTEINESNWLNHPKIVEVREIYNEVEGEIRSKNVIEQKKIYEYSEPYAPTLKVIYFDKYNIVRKYTEEAGSDDSALEFYYYYDHQQLLRFVFIKGGAVNGSILEHRIYFDSNGKKIWEIQKYPEGPGYPFPEVWPESELVFDPWKAFTENDAAERIEGPFLLNK